MKIDAENKNFTKKLEFVEKNQVEILELRNTAPQVGLIAGQTTGKRNNKQKDVNRKFSGMNMSFWRYD